MPDTVVVSIGGSFLVGKDGVDVSLSRELGDLLARVAESRRVIAVVGGGATARRYISAARELGLDEAGLDDLGIAVTRLNARVLIAALGPRRAYPVPPRTLDEALAASGTNRIVVMGGTHAGHTTDAVACMMAERAGATRVIIATNVDGVYDKDPNKFPDAKRLAEVSAPDLVALTSTAEGKAGGSGVVDSLGARIIARSGLEGAVVHGRDLKALEAALTGADDFAGTRVVPVGGA